MGEEAVKIDGNIRRVAMTVDKMLSIWKYVHPPVLFDGGEGRPAKEADRGTVSEVTNENAIDATAYS